MEATQQRALLSFRRVIAFIDARPNLTDGPTSEHAAVAAQLDALEAIVERISANAADQLALNAATTYAATEEPGLKRMLLDHHLRAIIKTARGLHGTVPGIGVLRVPAGNLRSARLVESASSFAKQATVYAPILIEHGQPADFVAQLHSAIDAFQASITTRGAARDRLGGASASVQQDIALGRRTIMVLDGAISRRLASDVPELTVWNAAKRVGQRSASGHRSAASDVRTPFVDQAKPVADQSLRITDHRTASSTQPTPQENQHAA